jgi:type I restriction enzyme S subunit
MINGWQTVSLGKILKRVERFEKKDDLQTYHFAGTYSFARGIFSGEKKEGSTFRLDKIQRVHKGDFIYCKIMAWEGAFGIAPEQTDNCVMSGAFVVYEIDQTKVEPKFLNFYFKQEPVWKTIGSQSTGTNVRRRSLHPNQFEKATIPLPPLTEQRRIVMRIEALARRVAEAQSLRREASEEAEALFDATIRKVIQDNEHRWERGSLPDYAEINPSRVGNLNIDPSTPVSFVPMRAVDGVSGAIAWPEIRPYSEVSKGYKWFINGDVIFARITPCMENGKSAIAENLTNGVGFGSTEFHVIRPGNRILAQWIHTLTRSKDFKDDAADHFKGTAGQQRVQQSFLSSKVIPVPPLEEQQRLVAYLDGLQAQVSALRAAQAETGKELSALMPSILDKAFKGEL